jgi:NADH pyrophosphatase NudC (nudix superfamily)
VKAERHESGEIQARGSVNGLPTTKRVIAIRRTTKFCTECGTRMMPSHRFCGGCGGKL